jgi:anti-anti-sigma factor
MDDQERLARAWAVVAMPAEIDQATAWRAGEELALAFGPGTSIVVADLTATTFCDSSGVQMFACAHMRAMVDNTELRLAVPSAAVRRIFALTGLDRLMPVYLSLGAALTDATAQGRKGEPTPG